TRGAVRHRRRGDRARGALRPPAARLPRAVHLDPRPEPATARPGPGDLPGRPRRGRPGTPADQGRRPGRTAQGGGGGLTADAGGDESGFIPRTGESGPENAFSGAKAGRVVVSLRVRFPWP